MTQITVNSNTYSDDGSAAKDMRGYGHVTHFLPMLGDAMVDLAAKQAASTTQANNAAASAATALAAPGTSATSTTSLTIGLGSKTLTIQTGKTLDVSMSVKIGSTASPTNWMHGDITAYNSGTGSLSVAVTRINGGGTIAEWTVSISGPAGVDANGLSGTTITGSVTLTASSSAAMSVTPTTHGLYATLPDATTCNEGVVLFSIYNAGDYDYGLKNSAGTQLGWVRPRTGAVIGLSDNSSAAGGWSIYGVEKTGITAAYLNSTLGNMSSVGRRVVLDANRTCILFGGSDCYAIVYDASTQTWGSATLIRAAIWSAAYIGVLVATDKILVVTCDPTTTMEAVTLTVAGTGITVNTGTKATATLAGDFSGLGQIIAVSTSWVFSYSRSTNVQGIRAITVSGTTPTIGAEYAAPPVNLQTANLFATGSVVRVVSASASQLYCTPLTVSGSTLTLGTGTNTQASSVTFRAFMTGDGNIVVHYLDSYQWCAIFKLTGTTEAVSIAYVDTNANATVLTSDCIAVSSSKTVFLGHNNSNTWIANIITDTAGTASRGTTLTGLAIGTISDISALIMSGNSARFAVGTNGARLQLTLDCSGASPVLSVLQSITDAFGNYCASPAASDRYGIRQPKQLIAGQTAYLFNINLAALRLNPASIEITHPPQFRTAPTVGFAGANTNESWSTGNYVSPNGFFITRVEAAE